MRKKNQIPDSKNPQKVTIIIFPHIIFQNGLRVDGLEIKSSENKFLKKESTLYKQGLNQIKQFFFDNNNIPVSKFSYITTHVRYIPRYKKEWLELIKDIDRFTSVLRFSKLSQENPNIHFSHFNFYVFEITSKQLENKDKINRYPMLINGQSVHYFFVEDSKVLDPYKQLKPHQTITLSDEEQTDIFNNYFFIFTMYLTDKEKERFLKAIEWYNRSLLIRPEIDRCEAVLNMTAAFEALLITTEEKSGKKVQIKNSVCNLLGEEEHLKKWVDSFWKLRNKIIHGDIDLPSFLYISPRAKSGHLDQLYISRKIFKECFEALLKLRKLHHFHNIHELLISNEERMDDATKLLRKVKHDLNKSIENGALECIENLNKFDVSPSINKSVNFGKVFLNFIVQNLDQTDDTQHHLSDILIKIISYKSKDFDKLRELYWQAYRVKPWHFINKYNNSNKSEVALGRALEGFMEYMYWRWLHYERQKIYDHGDG